MARYSHSGCSAGVDGNELAARSEGAESEWVALGITHGSRKLDIEHSSATFGSSSSQQNPLMMFISTFQQYPI